MRKEMKTVSNLVNDSRGGRGWSLVEALVNKLYQQEHFYPMCNK